MELFDVVILGLLIFGGIIGFQRGLISGISKLAGKIAAIGIAIVFHKPFLNIIDPMFGLREIIEPKINQFLLNLIEGRTGSNPYIDSGGIVQPAIGEATLVLTDYVLKIGSLLLLFMIITIAVNIIITVIINPLAKTLSVVDRGGGLVLGLLGMLIGICLVVGLIAPFLTTAGTGILTVENSLLYPLLMQGYEAILAIITAFAGDVLVNPLDAFPMLKETAI